MLCEQEFPFWMKRIEKAVIASLDLPMCGQIPNVDLDLLNEKLREELQIDPEVSFHLSIKEMEWKSKEQLTDLLAQNTNQTLLQFDPVGAPLILATTDGLFDALSALFQAPATPFLDPDLRAGFNDFALLQFLRIFNQLNIYDGASVNLSDLSPPLEESYCLQIESQIGQTTHYAHLIIGKSGFQAIKDHFGPATLSLRNLNAPESLMLETALVVGSTQIKPAEWDGISVGDLLLCDHLSYSPSTQKGSCKLYLNNTPLFHLKGKEDGLKILDYLYDYEDTPMSQPPEFPDDAFLDPLEDPIFSDTDEAAPPPPPLEEESPEPELPPTAEAVAPTPIEEDAIEKVSLANVDMDLRIEMGRVNISLDKLGRLAPGSTLPLTQPFGRDVFVTCNGKAVAKGEIVELEETIGVQIKEIY
ncbi:MAG: hypothetical protein S4CHLAM102_12620 [Chlamydiia bacterium]|nr:hypothetical protein [Chlamydiia bacterium]